MLARPRDYLMEELRKVERLLIRSKKLRNQKNVEMPKLLVFRRILCKALGWLDDEEIRLAVRDLITAIDRRLGL